MTLDTQLVAWEIHRLELTAQVKRGIAAMILAYYENYTDATELETSFIGSLLTLVDELALNVELYEVIRDAERFINLNGGVQSDTDGEWHPVKTHHVWEEVEAWEKQDADL